MYVTQSLVLLALSSAVLISAQRLQFQRSSSPVNRHLRSSLAGDTRALTPLALAALVANKQKSNRYGDLRLASSLWSHTNKPSAPSSHLSHLAQYGFPAPLAYASSQSMPTFATLSGDTLSVVDTGSRLKSYLSAARPRKPVASAALLSALESSQSQFSELGLSVSPGVKLPALGSSSSTVFRKYRGRIPRLPISSSIKGALYSRPKLIPYLFPLKLSSASLLKKPHKSKFILGYLKRPKLSALMSATDLPLPVHETPQSALNSQILLYDMSQKIPSALLEKKPHYKPLYKPQHTLHFTTLSQDDEDDVHFPKDNEPILPQEPNAQLNGLSTSFAAPSSPQPEQIKLTTQSLPQQSQKPSQFNHGQIKQDKKQIKDQKPQPEPQHVRHYAQETRPLPVYREVPIRQPQRPRIQHQLHQSHSHSILPDLNSFDSLSALASAPSAASILSSIPFLSNAGSLQNMISSALQGSLKIPSGLQDVASSFLQGGEHSDLAGLLNQPFPSSFGQSQFPKQSESQLQPDFRAQYNFPGFSQNTRKPTPPSYKTTVKVSDRSPLRSYGSGWVPKDIPSDWQPGPFRSGLYSSEVDEVIKFTIHDRITSRPGEYVTPASTTSTSRTPVVKPTSPIPATKPIKPQQQVIQIYTLAQPDTTSSPPSISPIESETTTKRARAKAPPSTRRPRRSTTTTTTTTSTTTELPTTITTVAEQAIFRELTNQPAVELTRTSVSSTSTTTDYPFIKELVTHPTTSSPVIEIFIPNFSIDKKVGLIRNPIWV